MGTTRISCFAPLALAAALACGNAAAQHDVADGTDAVKAAPRPSPADARKPPLAPSYGPVLDPRAAQPQGSRKDPAEVHDETEPLTRQAPAAQERAQAAGPLPKQNRQQKPKQARRPAWQGAGPLAPRAAPAGTRDGTPTGLLPIPAPAAAPQAPPRGSSAVTACQGGLCTDAAGAGYTGSGPAVINGGGRLCTRGTATVQCF
jgi:hypothetical protein